MLQQTKTCCDSDIPKSFFDDKQLPRKCLQDVNPRRSYEWRQGGRDGNIMKTLKLPFYYRQSYAYNIPNTEVVITKTLGGENEDHWHFLLILKTSDVLQQVRQVLREVGPAIAFISIIIPFFQSHANYCLYWWLSFFRILTIFFVLNWRECHNAHH